jgi:sugar-specific transcriptional regulator TrmB
MTPQELTNIGLDPTEAKVYLALLELGPSKVTDITKKAGITRTLGYHVLQKLGWYGLIDHVPGARTVFAAQHPRRIIQFAEQKRSSWERRIETAEAMLPELVSLFKTAEKPSVRYQDGSEGIKAMFNETLESKTEILSIVDMKGWDMPAFRQWGKAYNRERSRRKIHERLLILDNPTGREWMKHYQGSSTYTELRWVKPELLKGIEDFGGEMNVYENKMVMGVHEPNAIGIAIESTALARILKALFEMAWERSESVNVRSVRRIRQRL